MKVGTLVLKLVQTCLMLFFCCIELSAGDRTLTEESAIINILEQISDDSIDLLESHEMEIIHRASQSTVDLCTPDEES